MAVILLLLPNRQDKSNHYDIEKAGKISLAASFLAAANILVAPLEFLIRSYKRLHLPATWRAANNLVTVTAVGAGVAFHLLVTTDRTRYDQTLGSPLE